MNKFITEPYETYYKDMKWKDVYLDGEKTKYKISDKGVLLSFIGKYLREMSGHIMSTGYVIHALHHNDKVYWVLEHRLVAIAFIPIPDELKEYSYNDLEVNHKKGDFANKSNNCVDNLEWVTSSGNKYHGYKTGLYKQGEDSPVSKYTAEQIEKVCKLLVENKLSRMQISKATGVDDCTIGVILSKEQWSSISDKYDFSNRNKGHHLYDKETKDAAIELLRNMETNGLSFSDIGRIVGMSRTSVWYLHNKMK